MEKYQRGDILGSGSFGFVSKATTLLDGKVVSIKMVDVSKTNEAIARKEIEPLLQLDHPNVVKYIESFKYDNYFCIVMEFCEGKTLRKFINEQKQPLSESYILQLFFQMVDVLKFCHDKKVIHRDLKPENIIISPNDQIKLIDFGVAKVFQKDSNVASTIAGTYNYMSPELVQGNKYSFGSDVWSLGIIIYEMMTFKRPFDDDNNIEMIKKICTNDIPPIAINYSTELINVVKLMLNKDQFTRIKLKTLLKHPTLWNFEKVEDPIFTIKKLENELNQQKIMNEKLQNEIQMLKVLKPKLNTIKKKIKD
jgi:NIMA (never in mitosis gene a)-related kinase